jgi:hypothetical protein
MIWFVVFIFAVIVLVACVAILSVVAGVYILISLLQGATRLIEQLTGFLVWLTEKINKQKRY